MIIVIMMMMMVVMVIGWEKCQGESARSDSHCVFLSVDG